MRLLVSHRTHYTYQPPSSGIIQTLRLTPKNHNGQYIHNWQIDISADSRLEISQDVFGNITHTFTHGSIADFAVDVSGEVETHDTGGVLRGTDERFPPSLFLRSTPLTESSSAIASFVNDLRTPFPDDTLGFLHALMEHVNGRMTYDENVTGNFTPAAEAFTLRRGVGQDYTHVFIACARSAKIPARFVSGHCLRHDGVSDQESGHAWAEAFVPELGWVAFDAANCICATDSYVRVAIGLDYLGGAPVRGTRYGGGTETLKVNVRVERAGAREARAAHARALKGVRALEKVLEEIPGVAENPELPAMGHNNPPEILAADPLNLNEVEEIGRGIAVINEQSALPSEQPKAATQVAKRFQALGRKIQSYLATKADIFISELAKTAGAEVAKWGVRLAAWGLVADALLHAGQTILEWLRALVHVL